jgi:hypothetical protein
VLHSKVLAALQHELQNKYQISSTIRHKGERGRRREGGVADFLKENLPSAFGIATGEVFSFNAEGVSPQCDIIVYDKLKTPVFGKHSSVQQIPIEGVYVIVEVRSILDVNALKDAARKFAAIRNLWKSGYPEKEGQGPAFCLFAFKQKTSANNCLRYLKDQDTSVFALDSGCSVWVGPEDLSRPSRPVWLPTVAPAAGLYLTLAFFFFGILECCQTPLRRLDFKQILLSF